MSATGPGTDASKRGRARVSTWSIGNRLKHDVALGALSNAVALRKPPSSCVRRTHRGSQYRSHDCQKRFQKFGFRASGSGKCNYYEIATVETFFKTLKVEFIRRHPWQTRQQATGALFKYINGFCNTRRHHSAIGNTSPADFEWKTD